MADEFQPLPQETYVPKAIAAPPPEDLPLPVEHIGMDTHDVIPETAAQKTGSDKFRRMLRMAVAGTVTTASLMTSAFFPTLSAFEEGPDARDHYAHEDYYYDDGVYTWEEENRMAAWDEEEERYSYDDHDPWDEPYDEPDQEPDQADPNEPYEEPEDNTTEPDYIYGGDEPYPDGYRENYMDLPVWDGEENIEISEGDSIEGYPFVIRGTEDAEAVVLNNGVQLITRVEYAIFCRAEPPDPDAVSNPYAKGMDYLIQRLEAMGLDTAGIRFYRALYQGQETIQSDGALVVGDMDDIRSVYLVAGELKEITTYKEYYLIP